MAKSPGFHFEDFQSFSRKNGKNITQLDYKCGKRGIMYTRLFSEGLNGSPVDEKKVHQLRPRRFLSGRYRPDKKSYVDKQYAVVKEEASMNGKLSASPTSSMNHQSFFTHAGSVLAPFGGTFTTAIVALALKRW